MNFDPSWGQTAQSVQQFWQEQWSKSLQSLPQWSGIAPGALGSMPGLGGAPNPWAGIMDAMQSAMPQLAGQVGSPVQFDANKLQTLQQD